MHTEKNSREKTERKPPSEKYQRKKYIYNEVECEESESELDYEHEESEKEEKPETKNNKETARNKSSGTKKIQRQKGLKNYLNISMKAR